MYVKDLRNAIAQAKANAQSTGRTWYVYVGWINHGYRVEAIARTNDSPIYTTEGSSNEEGSTDPAGTGSR